MKHFRLTLLGIAMTAVPFLSVSAQTAEPDPVLAAQLRKNDELLLTAVHTADRAIRQKLAAPDFFYLDEAGGVTYLDAFLRELAPMATKPLQIKSYKLTRASDTAVVLHEDVGQDKVRYIFTETWQDLNGTWKLRALHITNVLSDPPAIQLSKPPINALVGTYRSRSRTYAIRREDDRILGGRAGYPVAEQKAETRDVLFSPGVDPRKHMVFLREEGKVTGFVDRYESSDTLWTREP